MLINEGLGNLDKGAVSIASRAPVNFRHFIWILSLLYQHFCRYFKKNNYSHMKEVTQKSSQVKPYLFHGKSLGLAQLKKNN